MVAETGILNTSSIGGLGDLRASGVRNEPEALVEAARQFEALFLQMMLQSMRSAGSSFAEDRDRSYEEMFDREIAVELARKDSLGIADLMLRQLGHAPETGTPVPNSTARGYISSMPIQESSAATGLLRSVNRSEQAAPRTDFRPDSPAEFLEQIWPLAQQTAKRLGVDARAIAAQAALESGWGQHLIRDAQGVSANNLFGIKADSRWDGERISVRTLEHESGVFTQRLASFRSYASLEAGFTDYANFLQSDSRYGEALAAGGNAAEFGRRLQDAGYATDPDYADKLSGILNGRLDALLEKR